MPGWLLALGAAAAWGLSAVVAKDVFGDVDPLRLSQWRAFVAAVILVSIATRIDRRSLRRGLARPRPFLLFGATLAAVNATYYLAIERLPVGVAVTIQYTGPLLVLVAMPKTASARVWTAGGAGLVGAALVAGLGDGRAVTLAGVVLAAASAVFFAGYLVGGEAMGRESGALVAAALGFVGASVVWAVLQPVWGFPFGALTRTDVLARLLVVGVVGTALPFALMVTALRLIPAGLAGVLASSEPGFAALFAWLLLGEHLAPLQIVGMMVTVVSVGIAQAEGVRAGRAATTAVNGEDGRDLPGDAPPSAAG